MIRLLRKRRTDPSTRCAGGRGLPRRSNPVESIRRGCLVFLSISGAALSQEEPAALRLDAGEAAKRFAISETDPKTAESPPPSIHPASYRDLLSKVTPAVVSVFPARLISLDNPDNDPISRFFGKESTDGSETMGLGSGVILSADGWIVTNSHVVHLVTGKLADSVSVELSDRRRFPATIVGADSLTDLALLKIEASNLPYLPIGDSDRVEAGDLVFALGNPFKVGMTATKGMVSATRRTNLELNGKGGFESFIQTDAAINPGNSGGALVDAGGRLIGINTGIYGPFGGNVGIGFAIPTRLMSQVLTGLARDGEMRRGFFGLQIEEVDEARAKKAGAKAIAGAWVAELMANGPSEIAGLKPGDLILRAGGREVRTRGDLRVELSCVRPGEKIDLVAMRDGSSRKITVVGAESPSVEQAPESTFTLDSLPGVKFKITGRGLEVTEIDSEKKGPGDRLETGMIIAVINGKSVRSADEASAALKPGVNKVVTKQGDSIRTLALRLE